jgi:hypothetical protein
LNHWTKASALPLPSIPTLYDVLIMSPFYDCLLRQK